MDRNSFILLFLLFPAIHPTEFHQNKTKEKNISHLTFSSIRRKPVLDASLDMLKPEKGKDDEKISKIITVKIYPPDDPSSVAGSSNSTFNISIPNPLKELVLLGSEASMVNTLDEIGFNAISQSLLVDNQLVDYSLLCQDGSPYLANGRPMQCLSESECPNGYWCHIGFSRTTTYCCPNAQENLKCSLPRMAGYGSGRMERWYHDQVAGGCQKFFYSGYGGNQNNFFTKEQCLSVCVQRTQRPILEPNQAVPFHQTGDSVSPIYMNTKSLPVNPSHVPYTSWSYVTVQPEMRMAIAQTPKPVTAIPTSKAPTVGQPEDDTAFLPQMYMINKPYPWQVTQTVMKPTVDEAVNQVWSLPAFQQPGSIPPAYYEQQSYNYPFMGLNPQPLLTPRQEVPRIPSTAFSSGWMPATTSPTLETDSRIVRPVTTTDQPVWYPPPLPTQHQSSYETWKDKVQTASSHSMIMKPADARCSEQKMVSVGLPNGELRWTFDSASGLCVQVNTLPGDPSPNQFTSQLECRFYCGSPSVEPRVTADPCQLNVDSGFGFSPDIRWTYKAEKDLCESFIYYGYGGNGNNFVSQLECTTACSSKRSSLITTALRPQISQPSLAMTDMVHMLCNGTKRINEVETCGTHNNYQCPEDHLCEYNGNLSFCCPLNPGASNNRIRKQFNSYLCNGTVHSSMAVHCTKENNYRCQNGYACSFSQEHDASVCCPTSSLQHYQSECQLPVDFGYGNKKIVRFYFDPIGTCRDFLYHGSGGNANNFETLEECRAFCERKPCAAGYPWRDSMKRVIFCDPEEPNSECPITHFCHIGGDRLSSVCCLREEKACESNIIAGNGPFHLERFAYDADLKRCISFHYTGFNGNTNNFLTLQECKAQCENDDIYASPCAMGSPAKVAGSDVMVHCSAENSNSCPNGYYCHIGSDSTTSVCCLMSFAPSLSGFSVCQLPLEVGRGDAILARWYFDSQFASCKPFTYTGMGGNENNFLKIEDCRRICPEYENACPNGTPPIDYQTGQVTFCSQDDALCPNGYWCHMGGNPQSSICCPYPADNPCYLPKMEGTGNFQLPRYNFDRITRQCLPFFYTGSKGNQNNFVSLQECESACPVIDNPCSEGLPLMDRNNMPEFCSKEELTVCPQGYWCHVGPTASQTMCCPGAADACQVPMSKGSGNAVMIRWYYNTMTKTCLSFSYTGRGGNQNNFLTAEACKTRCPEFQNPCSTGPPHIGLDGRITRCGATSPTVCPTTYWCHIGATLESSVCCPGASNPCDMSKSTGIGAASLLRYYYDYSTQTCVPFSYSGSGGNENNFMTLQDCEQRCPVFRNPCQTGEPARSENGQIVQCGVANMEACPDGYWCHIGADEQSTLCCPRENEIASFGRRRLKANDKNMKSFLGVKCMMPVQPGNGVFALPRFHYNGLTKQCLPFIYTGSGGNRNNFLSLEDCERSCPVFTNPCTHGQPAALSNGQHVLCTATNTDVCPPNYWCHLGDSISNTVCCPGSENACVLNEEVGYGDAVLVRWYFDRTTRRCNSFIYSGSGGNQNNFVSKQDCMQKCPELQNPCRLGEPALSSDSSMFYCNESNTCPTGYWCHFGADPTTALCCQEEGDPCLMPMLPGTGSDKLKRWYFSQTSRQCLEFTYTGLGGNQNNFQREHECGSKCPVFENPCPDARPDDKMIHCNSQDRDSCPSGYWCHVGLSPDASVCCPGRSDNCELPVNQGAPTKSTRTARWYFDLVERVCKLFYYTGVGGNSNNFLTKFECQQKCPEFVNPCNKGEPYRSSQSGLIIFCDQSSQEQCPLSYWCHVGVNKYSTVCCYGDENPCSLPLSVGTGAAKLNRWYFDKNTEQCRQFYYRGMGGNRNSFVTLDECRHVCPEFANPCDHGFPLTEATGSIIHCSPENPYICPVDHYCHVGASVSVCCTSGGDPCGLPLKLGSGISSLKRWYFNGYSSRCESFSYRGAFGNANNFASEQLCNGRCNSKHRQRQRPTSDLTQKPESACRAGAPYVVNGDVLLCTMRKDCPQNYHCYWTNWNKVGACCPNLGDRSAENPCSLGTLPYYDVTGQPLRCYPDGSIKCPANYYCHIGAEAYSTVCCPLVNDTCQQPMNMGVGHTRIKRWYYDVDTGQCHSFVYTGSGGNANNFLTHADCTVQCVGKIEGATNSEDTKLCPHGEPIITATGEAKGCAPQCPKSYTCASVDGGPELCCPDPLVFCNLSLDGGRSNCQLRSVVRFAFHPFSRQCVPFEFSGCGGNLNNFSSNEECLKYCHFNGDIYDSPEHEIFRGGYNRLNFTKL